jgi:hypothetical protein
MRHSLARAATVSAVCAAILLGGCASDYGSFYSETDHERRPKPVPAESVWVVRSADDLGTPWSELGNYEGHAPTVKEAMDAAKRECGRAGADFFILDVEPFESRGVWKVDGRCAVRTAAPPQSEASAR